MRFSVIYSVDVPHGVRIRHYAPPQVRKLWTKTEDDKQYESGDLGGRWEKKGRHRKWTALLTQPQFDDFVCRLNLYAEDVETLGSLGAPGFGYGWSPAISFTTDDSDAILNAYVTPIPDQDKADKSNWQRVRQDIVSAYR